MSEYVTKRRIAAAALMVGVGAASIAGCSASSSANKQVTGKPYESAGPSLPPLFAMGDIMHCQTMPGPNGSRPIAKAGFEPGVDQAISHIFKVPLKEIQKYGRAFLASCDLSMTGSMISQGQPIPEVAGDPKAAGKLCIVWEALYQSQTEAHADAPLNTFIVVCDTSHAEVHPSATATPSRTTQA